MDSDRKVSVRRVEFIAYSSTFQVARIIGHESLLQLDDIWKSYLSVRGSRIVFVSSRMRCLPSRHIDDSLCVKQAVNRRFFLPHSYRRQSCTLANFNNGGFHTAVRCVMITV